MYFEKITTYELMMTRQGIASSLSRHRYRNRTIALPLHRAIEPSSSHCHAVASSSSHYQTIASSSSHYRIIVIALSHYRLKCRWCDDAIVKYSTWPYPDSIGSRFQSAKTKVHCVFQTLVAFLFDRRCSKSMGIGLSSVTAKYAPLSCRCARYRRIVGCYFFLFDYRFVVG